MYSSIKNKEEQFDELDARTNLYSIRQKHYN